jgi:glutamate--cysteine ligase
LNPQTTISSINDIVKYYQDINPDKDLYVGLELERSGVYLDSLEPVQYEGDKGYLAVFKKLVEECGWEIEKGDGDNISVLKRGETRITTEGDGRPELSGSPMENLHDLAREFRLHDNELIEIGNLFNIRWIPLGFQPLHEHGKIPYCPSNRYKLVSEYFSNEFTHMHMLQTNGVAINVSYTDEKNAMLKAQAIFRLLPILGAMCASSPFQNGKRSPYLNMRRSVNVTFAEERTRMPLEFLDEDYSLQDWIGHCIDLPVIIIVREDGNDLTPKNLTFRQWMEQGFEGVSPTIYDFDQHIKTIWSDIRLRQGYLEYRIFDSLPTPLSMAVAALTKGLCMSSVSWSAIATLTKDWTVEEIIDCDRRSWETGLQTMMRGKSLLYYAQELLVIANEALHNLKHIDASGNDESVYLAPLKEQIFIKEKSPSAELVELWDGEWNKDTRRVVDWCK